MSDSFSFFLNKAGKFSEQEALFLKQELDLKELKKEEYLLEMGSVCSSLCFVISGSFCHYLVDSEGDKKVIDLSIQKDWVINYKSFASRRPSAYSIQAFEDTSYYEISIDAIHRLIGLSQSFLQIGSALEESTSRIEFFDNDNTPDEKYDFIIKNKPDLLQKFPQTIIASYLKMTPETLSRVRKRLS